MPVVQLKLKEQQETCRRPGSPILLAQGGPLPVSGGAHSGADRRACAARDDRQSNSRRDWTFADDRSRLKAATYLVRPGQPDVPLQKEFRDVEMRHTRYGSRRAVALPPQARTGHSQRPPLVQSRTS